MTSPARRPWWKRKRSIAAAVLWLALPILYPLSLGPAAYAVNRGWLPAEPCIAFYHPLWLVASRVPQIGIPLEDYFQWSLRLGREHAAASD